jgi:hypothetical protein
MWLAGVALVVGLTAGVLTSGRLPTWRSLHVRRLGLLGAGTALLVLAQLVSGLSVLPVAVGWALLLAFALSNLHLVGMSVVAVGLALNLAPTIVDGAVPVDPGAMISAHLMEPDAIEQVAERGGRRLQEPNDRLAMLGEVIPLAPLHTVASFGDLIAVAGLGDVAFRITRRRARRSPAHPSVRAALAAAGTTGVELRARPQPAITAASDDHDWGMAPRPVPVSGFQYSAMPDASAPAAHDDASEAASDDSDRREAATHSR